MTLLFDHSTRSAFLLPQMKALVATLNRESLIRSSNIFTRADIAGALPLPATCLLCAVCYALPAVRCALCALYYLLCAVCLLLAI